MLEPFKIRCFSRIKDARCEKKALRRKDILIKGIFEPFVDPALIQEITPSPVEYGYRNKAFFPVSSRKGRLIFGMYQSWTHTVIPHKACQIQMPIFDKIAQRVIELAQKSKVKAYEETKHAGNLRQIGFRSSSDGKEILPLSSTGRYVTEKPCSSSQAQVCKTA